MSGLKAIGMVFGLLWFLFILGFGLIMSDAGQKWSASGYDQEAANMIAESDQAEASYRENTGDEWESERRRQRDGVIIEPDSTHPMVDVDPNHR